MRIILILCCLTVVRAVDVFNSNCTLPETRVNYVSTSNTRGTLDILWTSLATIIACVYTVLHLNVPEQLPRSQQTWLAKTKWQLKNTWISLQWTLLTVFLPELTLTKSVTDWVHARSYLRRLHRNRPATRDYWTFKHMLFAMMGGFVGVWHDETELPNITRGDSAGARTDVFKPTLTQSESAVANTDGFKPSLTQSESAVANTDGFKPNVTQKGSANEQHEDIESQQELESTPHLWHFTVRDLAKAIEEELVDLPPVTEADIDDMSKSDLVSKTVAIFQITYFVVGAIVRSAEHLPISQLELGACAFVPYAIAIYIFSYDKPKSVRTTTTIKTFRGGIPDSIKKARKDTTWDNVLLMIDGNNPHGTYIRNGMYEARTQDTLALTIGLPILLSIPFGAIHLAAWNFEFPSYTDQQLWRAAAVVTTTALPSWVIIRLIHTGADRFVHSDTLDRECWQLWAYTIPVLILFFLGRIIIIVEMFRCMGYLPPAAFQGTWLNNIPHIG